MRMTAAEIKQLKDEVQGLRADRDQLLRLIVRAHSMIPGDREHWHAEARAALGEKMDPRDKS